MYKYKLKWFSPYFLNTLKKLKNSDKYNINEIIVIVFVLIVKSDTTIFLWYNTISENDKCVIIAHFKSGEHKPKNLQKI